MITSMCGGRPCDECKRFYQTTECPLKEEPGKKKKIYVSGKITGLDKTEAVDKFEKARKKLIADGFSVFVPTILPEYPDVSHDDYLHICYAMIDVCDAIYMLKDWTESDGARKEIEHAKGKKKEIMYERQL